MFEKKKALVQIRINWGYLNVANILVMQVKSIFQWELQLTLLLTADYKADVTQVNSSIKEDCN